LGGVIVLAILVYGAIVVFIKLQPSPAPLTLSKDAPHSPTGPLDGSWTTGPGSVAGFRVEQTSIGISSNVVGRTSEISGTVTVAGGEVTGATLRVDLPSIRVDGHSLSAFDSALDTADYPTATFTLTQPIALGPGVVAGSTHSTAATGRVALHGHTDVVQFPVSVRRNGSQVEATGSVSILFATWGIKAPSYGALGSVADHGVVEFLAVFHRGT
jgi:polyisoprenoid-binding protein YceI